MNTKNSVSEIKALDERGEGVLVFATLNAIDKESDVTLPGAFGEQDVPIVPAHDWTGPPIGKAKIYETHNEGRADFALNLETRDGRN